MIKIFRIHTSQSAIKKIQVFRKSLATFNFEDVIQLLLKSNNRNTRKGVKYVKLKYSLNS